MKKYVLPFGMVLLVVFASGCIMGESGPVCNEPYILVGTDCCLDENSNGICDSDEIPPEPPEEEPEEPAPTEELSGTECVYHTDCDDNDACTTDGCVNGICMHTQNVACPSTVPIDVEAYIARVHCNETEGEWEGHYLYNNEWVLIRGQGVTLTGWTLEDTDGNVFDFPDGFELWGELYVHTGFGILTKIDVYQGSRDEIWEDDDTAYLKNSAGHLVSQMDCE
jgi:hypothetical protein